MINNSVRNLAVLFADLVGYLPRTYDLPPQDAVAILNPLLCEMIAAISENGGKVVSCFGDGILAVFNDGEAPVVLARAIQAALRLHERVGTLDFAARCGIGWGAVYFGEIGSPLYRQVTVIGSCVDLAARLQKKAGPGETICSESVHQYMSHIGHWQEQDLVIKGLPQPVRAYLLAPNKRHH
jgi:class 3 adenylate cyclase